MSDKVVVMDTTSLHNEEFVTKAPKGDPLYDGYRALAWPELIDVVALAGADIGPETPNVKGVTITLDIDDEPMKVRVERSDNKVETYKSEECCFGIYKKELFRRLCQRLGVLWELRTISVEIRVAEGEIVTVIQKYNPVEPVTESD